MGVDFGLIITGFKYNRKGEKHMGTTIVVIILVIIALLAIGPSVKHIKGEGDCCGGGGDYKAAASPVQSKKLEGDVIAKKIITIKGMHCDNCKNSVERHINKIDGAVAKVDLKTGVAEVLLDREVSDRLLRMAVTDADFEVVSIESAEL